MNLLSLLCSLAVAGELPASEAALDVRARDALKSACRFAEKRLAIHGGYLGQISVDFKVFTGEGKATRTQNWIQPPGTPTFGFTYLAAYEATGDEYYLSLARQVATALAYGQLASGGWDYIVDHDPRGKKRWYYRHDREAGVSPKGRRNQSTFDDNTTQAALRFLIAFHRASKDESFRKPIDYGLAFMLESQFPNGAWPQRYPLSSKGYSRWYTFNDNAMNDCIRVMLDAYRAFGKEEYRRSVLKAGDFILAAQGKPPQAGWAQQYDHAMKPAAARRFEPVAWCPATTVRNLGTLVDIYLFSGDARYLKPFESATGWLTSCQLPDGSWPRFVELETNKPLYFTKDYRLTYDDSDMPTHYAFKGRWSAAGTLKRRDRIVAMGREAYLASEKRAPTARQLEQRLRAAAAAAEAAIAALDAEGRWVSGGVLKSSVFNANAGKIVAYLEAVKGAAGVRR